MCKETGGVSLSIQRTNMNFDSGINIVELVQVNCEDSDTENENGNLSIPTAFGADMLLVLNYLYSL